MSRAEIARQCLTVGAEFREHFFRGDAFVVVVLQTLVPGDLTDRVQRGSADFARTFGYLIGHGKDLFRMLVEQQVIVPEVLPGHVPVEILGLQIQSKCIGQQSTQLSCSVGDAFAVEVSWYFVHCLVFLLGLSCGFLWHCLVLLCLVLTCKSESSRFISHLRVRGQVRARMEEFCQKLSAPSIATPS